ncbi:MAG: ATP-binding cassette domain-containing protein [Ilumatobacteraceae bacterium]
MGDNELPRRWTPSALLQLVGVTKRFGDVVAVDDVSLHVGRGEVLGLVGASGSGKSTIARLVTGLTAPDAGRVLLDGAPLASSTRAIPPMSCATPPTSARASSSRPARPSTPTGGSTTRRSPDPGRSVPGPGDEFRGSVTSDSTDPETPGPVDRRLPWH